MTYISPYLSRPSLVHSLYYTQLILVNSNLMVKLPNMKKPLVSIRTQLPCWASDKDKPSICHSSFLLGRELNDIAKPPLQHGQITEIWPIKCGQKYCRPHLGRASSGVLMSRALSETLCYR